MNCLVHGVTTYYDIDFHDHLLRVGFLLISVAHTHLNTRVTLEDRSSRAMCLLPENVSRIVPIIPKSDD